MSVRVVLCEDHAALRAIVRETCVAGRPRGRRGDRQRRRGRDPRRPVGGAGRRARPQLGRHAGGDDPARGRGARRRAAIVAYTGLAVADLDDDARHALTAHVAKTAPLTDLMAEIERAAPAPAA